MKLGTQASQRREWLAAAQHPCVCGLGCASPWPLGNLAGGSSQLPTIGEIVLQYRSLPIKLPHLPRAAGNQWLDSVCRRRKGRAPHLRLRFSEGPLQVLSSGESLRPSLPLRPDVTFAHWLLLPQLPQDEHCWKHFSQLSLRSSVSVPRES